MIIRTPRILLACTAVLAVAAGSEAGTITFNGTVNAPEYFQLATTPYSEAGFTITPGAGVYFIDSDHPSSVANYPGLAGFDDDVLEFDLDLASFTLAQDGGGIFDLSSVRTGSLRAADEGNFIFTGFFAGGGSISTTVPGLINPQVFNFVGFTNLTSVRVTTSDGTFPVLDDLTVNPTASVPDAGSGLAMLSLGMMALGTLRRKLS